MREPTSSASNEPSQESGGVRLHASGQEHFRLMVEAVKDYGIFMLDPEGYVVSWNEGAARINGYEAEEIIGLHFSTFYPEEAIATEWPQHELKVASREGRFEDEGWRLRKDGSAFWANVVITALHDVNGVLVGFTKVTRDLSERRRYEEALRESERRLARANQELMQRNRDLEEFAYVAGHDLQEPLRKINTFGEMLESDYRDNLGENGRLYVDRMRVSAQRMAELVRDLLAYSRVTTNKQPFQRVDLNRLVTEVLGDLYVSLEESGGKVNVGHLPAITADPTQMRQLFQNLIANSLKFKRAGVTPVVQVSAERGDDNAYRIIVEDNGIGFESRFLDRIFDPFQRLHPRGKFEGTGLGLTICRRIVDRHAGYIEVDSTPGEGSRFVVTLPVDPSTED
jgi:PAS domain S-box-containing protein